MSIDRCIYIYATSIQKVSNTVPIKPQPHMKCRENFWRTLACHLEAKLPENETAASRSDRA